MFGFANGNGKIEEELKDTSNRELLEIIYKELKALSDKISDILIIGYSAN